MTPDQPASPHGLDLRLDPISALLRRVTGELSGRLPGQPPLVSADTFDPARPVRVARAPGRLDVMGGIADYTGSLVCQLPIDRAAAVAVQGRPDRQLQVFSFNLLDENVPFTFRMSLDDLAGATADELRRGFSAPGRTWAGYLAGCLFILHDAGLLDLRDARHRGVNLALYSTVPAGAGVSSSAAIEVAAMMALIDHFALRPALMADANPALRVAALCQAVENRVVGVPCGIMDQAASCAGTAGAMLRIICQPHDLLEPLAVPAGMRFVGIDSKVKRTTGGGPYGISRCAAFMAHRLIVERMRQMGDAAGKELTADPTRGYLANLSPDDYKRFFRPSLPTVLSGQEFLARFGPTADAATRIDPHLSYPIQHAADHHVLEAQRVRNFARFVEQSLPLPPDSAQRGLLLDKAGHLMYASHFSYGNDAMLGCDECDLLVKLVRARERQGLYGARITGAGSGGTVAVLGEATPKADVALAEILRDYREQTGRTAELFAGTSPGAWQAGTALASLPPPGSDDATAI